VRDPKYSIMKISVVIPLYNKELSINRTIQSVLNQNYPPDEIIIVNDGSSDGSIDIVKRFSDSRIMIINQRNLGQNAARNRGVYESKNKFIAFLDADDEWDKEYLITIRQLFLNFPDCGAYATSSKTVKPGGKINYPKITTCPPEPWIGILPNFFKIYQFGMIFNSSSIVIPKKILEEIGGFDENISYSADIDCWVKIAIKYPIAFSPKRLSIYHQDAENRNAIKNSLLIEMPVVQTIRKFIRSGEINEGELKIEALEYVAKRQIIAASYNIMAGNKQRAMEFLLDSKYTKKYRRLWLYWYFWSILPAGILNKLLRIKELIRGY
jgi:glycosyltransferase involved in cell wall biosynthesis